MSILGRSNTILTYSAAIRPLATCSVSWPHGSAPSLLPPPLPPPPLPLPPPLLPPPPPLPPPLPPLLPRLLRGRAAPPPPTVMHPPAATPWQRPRHLRLLQHRSPSLTHSSSKITQQLLPPLLSSLMGCGPLTCSRTTFRLPQMFEDLGD